MFAPRLFIVLNRLGMMVAEGIWGMVGLSLGAATSSSVVIYLFQETQFKLRLIQIGVRLCERCLLGLRWFIDG